MWNNFLKSLDPTAFFSKAVDFGLGLIAHDKQKDTSKDLMNWQNENAIKFWQLNNEYNSPLNQMKRLQQAGINPNLAFSNGQLSNVSASSPSASSPNSVNAPNFGNQSLADSIVLIDQLKNNESQRNLMKFQAQMQEMQALTESFKQGNLLAETIGKQWQNKYNVKTEQHQIDLLQNTVRKVNEEANLISEQKLTERLEQQLKDSQVKLTKQQCVNLTKQLEVMQSEIVKNYSAVEVNGSIISLNHANESLAYTHQDESIKRRDVLSQQEYEYKLKNMLRSAGLDDNSPLFYKLYVTMKNNPNAVTGYIMAIQGFREYMDETRKNIDAGSKAVGASAKLVDAVIPNSLF